MAYIGKTPTIGNFQKCDAITVVNGQAAYTMQVGGTNVSPESENHMLVSLNGILQAPVDSFTISGSTITFASNLATGDVIDFIMLLGNVLDLGVPSDNTVTAAKLNNDIISGQTALTTAPADTDEFLVSDAGTIKRIDYSLIKGGGCWEKLVTTSISSAVAQVDFTSTYLTTTHLDYMIVASGIKNASDGQHLRYWVSTDGGSTFVSTGYANARRGHQDDADIVSAAQTGSSGLYFTPSSVGNSTGEIANFVSIFFDPLKQSNTTDNYLCILTDGVSIDTAGDTTRFYSGNMYPSTTAVNGIRLFVQSGNISSGSVTLYGRKV